MSKSKGARREREAREIYEQAGYAVQPFYGRSYGETDGFGLFDLLCMHPDRRPRVVQVKSNRAQGIRAWIADALDLVNTDHVELDYAVPVDKEGWRLLQIHEETYRTVYDERKDDRVGPHRDTELNLGAGLVEYLSDG